MCTCVREAVVLWVPLCHPLSSASDLPDWHSGLVAHYDNGLPLTSGSYMVFTLQPLLWGQF
jgi:hypothetical protein